MRKLSGGEKDFVASYGVSESTVKRSRHRSLGSEHRALGDKGAKTNSWVGLEYIYRCRGA